MGLATMFVSKLLNTSANEAVDSDEVDTSLSWRVTGNNILATTAHIAAINVLNKYLKITLRKRAPNLLLALAIEAITNTATNTGAIAFKALTNKVPRIPIAEAEGTNKPKIVPTTRPITIRNTKLVSVHFFNKLLISSFNLITINKHLTSHFRKIFSLYEKAKITIILQYRKCNTAFIFDNVFFFILITTTKKPYNNIKKIICIIIKLYYINTFQFNSNFRIFTVPNITNSTELKEKELSFLYT